MMGKNRNMGSSFPRELVFGVNSLNLKGFFLFLYRKTYNIVWKKMVSFSGIVKLPSSDEGIIDVVLRTAQLVRCFFPLLLLLLQQHVLVLNLILL